MCVVKIEITEKLIGSLSETYFKEFCDQKGWAYISLEQIHENKIKNNTLKFKKGFNRVPVHLPEKIVQEVESISIPSNRSILKPSFVYDFLLCKIDLDLDAGILIKKNFKDFRWAEVKTGYSELSKRQILTLKKIKIPLYRYRIPHSVSESKDVDIYDDLVDSKYLFRHGLDSEGNKIDMDNFPKENKTSFKKVTPQKFVEIKQGLKKLFKTTQYQSNDPHIDERFEIVKSGAKFHVLYYKKGTLLIQGDESLVGFKQVIKFIEFSLENVS